MPPSQPHTPTPAPGSEAWFTGHPTLLQTMRCSPGRGHMGTGDGAWKPWDPEMAGGFLGCLGARGAGQTLEDPGLT